MKIGSLCTGYGGLDMATETMFGATTAWFCEIDKVPSQILAHHYPNIVNHGNVKTTDWQNVEPIDILTAGYPCQPFSTAGLRRGTNDARHLWPDVATAIGILRPRIIILENVRGHLSLGADAVIGQIAAMGYDARWGIVRASEAGATHQRARIFIIATDPEHRQWERIGEAAELGGRSHSNNVIATNTQHHGSHGAAVGRSISQSENQRRLRESERPRIDTQPKGNGIATNPNIPMGRNTTNWGRIRQESWDDCERISDTEKHRWGKYYPAIKRWENIIGRPAPHATDNLDGRPRLNPLFVEWMMGLPEHHVTNPVLGLSRNQQLKTLGNGVVPQQAMLAIDLLTQPI
jgi:DNA (cytosine-5)-methyltransferase 1